MRALPAGNGMDAAADADLRARPLRSRRRRPLAAGQLPQGRPADRADQLARRDDGPDGEAGSGPIEPDPVLGPRGELPLHADRRAAERPGDARVRRRARSLHADHELNASTFAARVAAATLTDIHSAIVGAIGALKGPLHGGANADVMRLLLEIGQDAPLEKAEEVVRAKLARKEKIPGFGHRVYHTEDPRATHLRQMSRDLGQRAGEPMWFEMSQRIEALVKAEKKLNPNVDFYSASTYHALGIDDRSVHADLRGQPRVGLDGARARAVREQPPDPPARRIHRARIPAARIMPLEAR